MGGEGLLNIGVLFQYRNSNGKSEDKVHRWPSSKLTLEKFYRSITSCRLN